MCKTSN